MRVILGGVGVIFLRPKLYHVFTVFMKEQVESTTIFAMLSRSVAGALRE